MVCSALLGDDNVECCLMKSRGTSEPRLRRGARHMRLRSADTAAAQILGHFLAVPHLQL